MTVKEQVLEALENNRGISLSGESLAEEMHVSRAAIHKAIKALRQEGFPIEAVTNKGYLLSEESDVLSLPGIRSLLDEKLKAVPIKLFQCVKSTNDTAKELAMEFPEQQSIIIANEQSQGKGRLGRSFYSPADNGVYMSFLFKPSFNISKAGLLTIAASVAVAKAIENLTPLTPQIKWVNDVYVDQKKVCGILTEAITDFESGSIASIVLGIGVNCGTAIFPEEIEDACTSLTLASKDTEGQSISKNALAAQIINHLLPLLDSLNLAEFLPYYKEHSLVLGKDIKVYKSGYPEKFEGLSAKAVDIDESGGLKVIYPSGERETLTTGEISIRLSQ